MMLQLAHECFTAIAFVFRVHIKNCRVRVSSLDMIGHGVMWGDVMKNSFTFSHDSHLHGIELVTVHLKIRFRL